MTPETLERLMLDRALGTLPPDTCELLAAYLVNDAAAQSRGREFVAVADMARRALGGESATVLPPFPVARIAQTWRAHRSLRLVRSITGLAAALLFGVGVGARVFSRPEVSPVPESLPRPAHAIAKTPVPEASRDFWSAARLYAVAQAAKPAVPAPESGVSS